MTRTLAELRTAVDAIDDRLVSLIAERVALAQAIAEVKRAEGLPIVDPEREAAVVDRVGALAVAHGLDDDELRALYWRLLALSRRAQLGHASAQAAATAGPET